MNTNTPTSSACRTQPSIAQGSLARVSSLAHEDCNACQGKTPHSILNDPTGEATPVEPRKMQTEDCTVTNRNISLSGRAYSEAIQDTVAFQPDPGLTADFQLPDNKFAFVPSQMLMLVAPKSLPAFYAVGGIDGIERGIRTERRSSLSSYEALLSETISLEEVKCNRPISKDNTEPHTVKCKTTSMPINIQRPDVWTENFILFLSFGIFDF